MNCVDPRRLLIPGRYLYISQNGIPISRRIEYSGHDTFQLATSISSDDSSITTEVLEINDGGIYCIQASLLGTNAVVNNAKAIVFPSSFNLNTPIHQAQLDLGVISIQIDERENIGEICYKVISNAGLTTFKRWWVPDVGIVAEEFYLADANLHMRWQLIQFSHHVS